MRRFVIVCALAAAAAGCSAEAASRRHFANGQQLLEQKRFPEAVVEFRNAVQKDESWGEARFGLATAYEAVGEPERAFREYIRASDLLPQDLQAQLKAASYLLLGRQYEDARVRAQRVLELDPRNIEGLIVLANALAGVQDLDGALARLREAIGIAPSRSQPYTNLARLQVAQGRRDEALAAYRTALALEPRSIPSHLALANFQWASGSRDAAEQTLKDALAIDANHVLANRALAALYAASGRPADAERYLITVARLSSAADDRLALADFYIAQHRLDDARRVLEPMLGEGGRTAPAETRLARVEYLQGDRQRAEDRLQRVLAREPNYAAALIARAERALDERRWEDALWDANVALGVNPRLVAGYYMRADAELRTGRHTDAIGSYAEVLKLDPEAVEAKVSLSRLHLARNEIDSAVLYAEEALRNAPENVDARLALVRAWIARRDIGLAAAELARVAPAAGESAERYVLEGWLLLERDDAAGARRSFERALALDPAAREPLTRLTALDVRARAFASARQRVALALAAEPGEGDLLLLAAKVSLAAGDYAEAERQLRRVIEKQPLQVAGYTLLARLLAHDNRLATAAAEFDATAAREPANLAARLMAAVAAEAAGRVDDAERRYREIVDREPRAALAANNLAAIYLDKGENLAYAQQLAASAVTQMPAEPELLDTLGQLYYRRGIYGLAIKQFQQAAFAEPGNAEFHYHLGLAYVGVDDPARARDSYQTALRLDPQMAVARTALAALTR